MMEEEDFERIAAAIGKLIQPHQLAYIFILCDASMTSSRMSSNLTFNDAHTLAQATFNGTQPEEARIVPVDKYEH